MNRQLAITGLVCLGVLVAGTAAVAEEGVPEKAETEIESRDHRRFRDLTPEERAQRREQFRKMTPEERRASRPRVDRDDNPPGRRGGPGTNWENPPGRRGGVGASPDRRGFRARRH